ncbi:MAG: MarR family winged helix-turn-helix transcriptional regulator [Anaerolineae bacterium]
MSNPHSRVATLIIQTVPRLMGALSSDLRRAAQSCNPVHFQVLLLLAGGECNLGSLAADMAVSLPTMSNTVSILTDRGWVASRRDPADRRRLLISLAPSGQAALEQIRDSAMDKIEQALAPLSGEECRQVIAGLETLNTILGDDSSRCGVRTTHRMTRLDEGLETDGWHCP